MSEKALFSQETLQALHTITRFNEIIGNINILKSLYDLGEKEWEHTRNQQSGVHLIEGIATASHKSDAIGVYVSKLVKVFLNAHGATLSAWSKETIASENTLTVSTINRMGSIVINDHATLFSMVATRLLGYDKALVELAMTKETQSRAYVAHLIGFLATMNGELEKPEDAADYMYDLVDRLAKVNLPVDRDQICTLAIEQLTNDPFTSPYNALTRAADVVIANNGPVEPKAAEPVPFEFPPTQYH